MDRIRPKGLNKTKQNDEDPIERNGLRMTKLNGMDENGPNKTKLIKEDQI